MFVEHRSIVYDAAMQPEERRVAFFAGLCPTASGAWLCGFTVGRTKHDPRGTICIQRSRDNGRTWQLLPAAFESHLAGVPGSLTCAEMVEVEPGRLLLFTTWFDRSEPDRPLFDPRTEGILRSQQLVAESRDEGQTWSDWRIVPTPGLTGTALTGPMLHWPDGSIGLAFESFKEFDDPAPTRHGSWLLISRDGGRSFERPYLVAQDPRHQTYYWDQRLAAANSPGEFVGLFWTHDRSTKQDLRVHLLQANARDGEGSRTLPVETTIPGQIAAPLLCANGRWYAFVVDRQRPGTMRLWSSHDHGKTWPESDSLVIHFHDEQAVLSQGLTDIDYAQYWEDMVKWTFGHPALRTLDDDRVLVSYYAGVPGCTQIRAAVVRVTATA